MNRRNERAAKSDEKRLRARTLVETVGPGPRESAPRLRAFHKRTLANGSDLPGRTEAEFGLAAALGAGRLPKKVVGLYSMV